MKNNINGNCIICMGLRSAEIVPQEQEIPNEADEGGVMRNPLLKSRVLAKMYKG